MKGKIILGLALLAAALPVRADELAVPGAGSAETQPVTYVVQKGDTLWDLSAKFYENAWEWPKIWKANPFIKDPHWIYPGQSLVLPDKMEPKEVAALPPTEVVAETTPAPTPAAAPAPVELPVPAPNAAPVAAPVVAAAPAISEILPKDIEMGNIPEELPPDLAGQEDTLPKIEAPLDWQPQGTIAQDEFLNATDGDVVHVKWAQDAPTRPDDVLHVLIHAGFKMDGKKKAAVYLQKIADVRVTKVLGARQVEGVIEHARDGVQPGNAVQIAAP